jgi:hypothetical protein
MSEQEKQSPRLAAEGVRRAEDRQDRQARALRENLLKRKAQQRARASAAAPATGEDAER